MTPEEMLKALNQGIDPADPFAGVEVGFLLVEHSAGCPGADGNPFECNCQPVTKLVSEADFMAAMDKTLQARKAASQAAREALAKVKGSSK